MKKNFIKKILVVGLITSLCLCFSFVVKASNLDNYSPTNGTQTLPLKTWEDIQVPNDLLGVTLLFNDIILPIGLPYDADPGYIQISYEYNFQEYELESKPIIWGCNYNGILVKNEIARNKEILRLEEEHFADYPLSIFSNGLNVFNLYDINYANVYTNTDWHSYWQFGPRLLSFPLDQRDPTDVQLELIVEGYNYNPNFETPWEALLSFLYRNTTIVYSSSMANDLLSLSEIQAFNEGYNQGYNQGYNKGYSDGSSDTGNNSYRFSFLTGIFNGVSDLLSLEIFPNVQLGYFVFIPLALGITGMIFWFWRKD